MVCGAPTGRSVLPSAARGLTGPVDRTGSTGTFEVDPRIGTHGAVEPSGTHSSPGGRFLIRSRTSSGPLNPADHQQRRSSGMPADGL